MNSGNEPIKPKIDDRYWFAYSETLVGKAEESRDQAAEKLQKLVHGFGAFILPVPL